jgi:glycosidase
MKKKKLIYPFIFTALFMISSCTPSDAIEEKEISIPKIDDNYLTAYEIFPYSFADSNRDGIGDLVGITDKIDYIASLNYDAIWLTPVHKSSSYHKYDVDDYKSIDSSFGTIADYDAMVAKAHGKGIKVLLDLVINHTSDSNLWFTSALRDHQMGRTDDKYYNYYNMYTLQSGESCPSGYTQIGNVVYESRFYSGMPDLNLGEILAHPDGDLAKDIIEIMRYRLIDRKVDGFRLDAVTSYFTGDTESNLSFLTWLNTEAKKIKPSCYIVGEGSWGNSNENKKYQGSGVDSFFMFEDSQSSGYIAQVVIQSDATYIPYGINKNLDTADDGIPAPFVANHDTGRMAGAILGKSDINKMKFGSGLLQMMAGSTFSYYGDEIGMSVVSTSADTVKDEDKRQPILRGDDYTCSPVAGSSAGKDEDKYPYGSVASQLEDESSVLNYVKKANLIRRQNPEIARGDCREIYSSDNDDFAVFSRSYGEDKIYVAINASKSKEFSYDFTSLNAEEVVGQLTCTGYIKQPNKDVLNITVPPYGIAIVR